MLVMIAFLAGTALLGLLAYRFGADTRDGRDWHSHPEP